MGIFGDGTYEIEEIEKKTRGTEVILQLKPFDGAPDNHDEDFLNQYTIQKHIQKHCNFIAYPIAMNFVIEEPESEQVTISERTLNSIQPIWTKNPKETEREQYVSFYRQHFHDWNEPAEILHTKSEGTVEFTALLFIPSQAPYGLYTGDPPKGPQLYCKHVLVVDDCRELLPDYLRFVRGIVDASDLPLNISRETLQHDAQMQVIKNHLEKKVLERLKGMLADERAKYEAFWKELGKSIKGGLFMDYRNTEKLQDLLIFESSHSTEQKTTLQEYVRAHAGATERDLLHGWRESRCNREVAAARSASRAERRSALLPGQSRRVPDPAPARIRRQETAISVARRSRSEERRRTSARTSSTKICCNSCRRL